MLGGGGSSDHTGQTGCVMGGGREVREGFCHQDLDQDQTK